MFLSLLCRWKDHAFTGHNSPLYSRPDETSESSPGYQLSSDFAIKYWLSLGARPAKLLLGIGAYGRGFNLADPADNGFYAPATSGIDAAMYTNRQNSCILRRPKTICQYLQTLYEII